MPDPRTELVEVQTIKVVSEVLALPGDTLLVFNGHVVGVREGGAELRQPASVSRPAPQIKAPSDPDKIRDADIIRAFEALGEAPVFDLCDHLGLDRKAYHLRSRVGYAVRRLARVKVLEVAPSDRKRIHLYRLSKPKADAPKLNGASPPQHAPTH